MTSSVSRSDVSTNKGYRAQINFGAISPLDSLFPLFNAMYQKISIHRIFSYPFILWFIIQLIFISIWPNQKYWLVQQKNPEIDNILEVMSNYFAFYFVYNNTETVLIASTCVYFALSLFSFAFIAIQLINYASYRKFISFLLYPIKFFSDTLLPTCLIPICFNIGSCFLSVANGKATTIQIAVLILGIVSLCYDLTYMVLNQKLSSQTVTIYSSPYLTFNPNAILCIMILPILSFLFSFLLMYFEPWTIIIAMVFLIASGIWTVIECFNFPFYSKFANPVIAALGSSLSLNSAISIICYFVTSISGYIPLILSISSFIFFIIIFIIIFGRIRTKIARDLTFSSEDTPKSDEELQDHFRELGLDQNQNKAITYLRIGFENMCNCFYNWSLIKFLTSEYTSEKVICECVHILNFFPGEFRLLNRLIGLSIENRNLNYEQRFLIYQISKIKTLRQFSSSAEANLKVTELRSLSRQCESLSRGAWDSSELTVWFFEYFASTVSNAHMMWEEALKDYPNNTKMFEEYSQYLVECECDFPAAIKMKHRASMIEVGRNYSIDYSFRSMIRMYPDYIKKEILDLKGNIKMHTKQQRRGSSGGGNSANASFESTSDVIDDDVEEALGKQLVLSPKTRIAVHNALETKMPKSVKCIIPATLMIVFALWVINLAVIVYASIAIGNQTYSMDRLTFISKNRFYMAIANTQILTAFVYKKGILAPYLKYAATFVDQEKYDFIDFYNQSNILPQVNMWVQYSTEAFQDLNSNLAELALTDDNVFTLGSEILTKSFDFKFCDGDKESTKLKLTLVATSGYIMAQQRAITSKSAEDFTKFLDSNEFCEVNNNLADYFEMTETVFVKFCEYQLKIGAELNSIFQIVRILVSAITLVIAITPYFILHFSFNKSIKLIIEVMGDIDSKSRQDAKERIAIGSASDEVKPTDPKKKSSASALMLAGFVIIGFVDLLLGFFAATQIIDANNDILKLNMWSEHAAERLSLLPEVVYTTLIASVIANKSIATSTVTTAKAQVALARDYLEHMIESHTELIEGDGESPPCAGFDRQLDLMNFVDRERPENQSDIHSLYEKAALNTQISMLRDFVNAVLTEAEAGTIGSIVPMTNLIHMTNSHMYHTCEEVTTRLLHLASVSYNDMITNIMLLILGGCIVTGILAILVSQYYRDRVNTFKGAIGILKRASPIALLNSKVFMTKFLRTRDELKGGKLSTAGNIIHNSMDAIVCTGFTGGIEIVNTSVSNLIGYTPEQLLGQPASLLFTPESEEKFSSQMEMMRNGQASAYFADQFTLMSDAGTSIPCHLTILGMKNQNSNNITSFVLIIRDETALVEQRKKAEEAKANSENLLFQILPRDIVTKLNRGEKDISFTINSATIMFIDIIRFSEYSASLTPQEIMGNLSMIFSSFDRALSKYPIITKIKLIGDIYMCAAGLFSPDAPPETHAEAMIRFAVDAIQELEDINTQLDASLSVRIGVNTGGPLIAGVLGKDRPVFDIIGDPINVAARLQTTCEPNRIHVTQAVRDLLKDGPFEIEPRGEVFLKGKGKTPTYFISMATTMFSQISSRDFNADA